MSTNTGKLDEPTRPARIKRAELAPELKRVSDDLNEVFLSRCREIDEDRPTVACWLDFPIQPDEEIEPYTEGGAVFCEGHQLGYAKAGGSRCIAVRLAKFRQEVNGYTGENEWRFELALEAPRPITEAPRLLRIQAVEYLDNLDDAINKKLEGYIDAIKKALARSKK